MTEKSSSEEEQEKNVDTPKKNPKEKEISKKDSEEKNSKEENKKQEFSKDFKKEPKEKKLKKQEETHPIQSRTRTLKPIEISKSSLEKTLSQEQPSQNLEQSVPPLTKEESEEDEIKYMNIKNYKTNKSYQTSQNQENFQQGINPMTVTPERANLEKNMEKNSFQTLNPIKAPELQNSSVSEDYVVKPKEFEDPLKKDIKNSTEDFHFEKTEKGYEIKR